MQGTIILSPYDDEKSLLFLAAKKSGIKKENVKHFKILKKSIDARRKNDVKILYTYEISESEAENGKNVFDIDFNCRTKKAPIYVIGAGPSGLFAALYLAACGLKPIVVERGKPVEERKKDVDNFNATGKLDINSNVQFGEGGAGTFSDGKLNTGVKSPYIKAVLSEFVKAGAKEEILYQSKPHVGSDVLYQVVKNIRNKIISLGGKFLFNTKLENIKTENGKVKKIVLSGESFDAEDVVLAIGHSARDTYKTLYGSGIFMEAKDFAVGVRIEHLRREIDKAQYGKFAGAPLLAAADYKLTSNVNGVGVFTFCMCPGGYVSAATSTEGGVCTNGFSLSGRNGENSNSAVVVQVNKNVYGEGLFGGLDFAVDLEKKAFLSGGGEYLAPCQKLSDFLRENKSKNFGAVKPTYERGVAPCDLNKVLPKFLCDNLKAGITDMDKRLRGFAFADALLTAVETRTSSPVRIVRKEDFSSLSAENLYPVGETGYAGGIMSSAVDGIKIAVKIAEKYKV